MNTNPTHIEEHILLQYLLGRTSAEEKAAVEAWLMESKSNRRLLDRLETLWAESGKLTPAPVAVDVDQAWERLSARIGDPEAGQSCEKKNMHPGRVRMIRYAFSVAAGVALLFGVYALIRIVTAPPEQKEWIASAGVLRDTLPDGSRVMLNAGSRLEFPERFEKQVRRVKLTGEAFFRVDRDPACPFIIDAGRAMIRVVGTAFNVSAFPGKEVRVSVEEGTVIMFTVKQVSEDTVSVTLEAGMSGELDPDRSAPEIVPAPLPDEHFWHDSTLVFRGTELNQVVPILQKCYGVSVRMSRPEIGNCRLTASFSGEPAGIVLRVIAESFNLDLTSDDKIYLLSGKGCPRETP